MVFLFEIYLSILRVIILVFTFFLTFILGSDVLMIINQFLKGANLPCLEIISFLIAVLPPIMIFYGIYEQKYFWQKARSANATVFVISFIIGVILSFLPSTLLPSFTTSPASYCIPPQDALQRLYHIIGTGLLASVFSFIGMDIGVSLKHVSKRIVSPHRKTRKTPKKKRR